MDSALITGCSPGGLGSGIALAFQKRDIHVFATARRLSALEHLKDLPNVTVLELDVTDKESVKRAVETARGYGKGEGGKRLKYLVNNAGRGVVGPLLDGDEETERKVWEVNYWGTLNMIKAFAPLLIERKGVIVNVGSSAGLINVPWNGIYASSKAAVNMLSETLRLELEPLNVRVVTAVLGVAKSEFFTNLNQAEFELPQSSYYKSLEKRIGVSARGGDLPENVMSAEECARDLVNDVWGGKRGNVYNGTGGFALKWFMPLVPTGMVDWYCRKRTHLGDFRGVKSE